jgi:hypothetical protein
LSYFNIFIIKKDYSKSSPNKISKKSSGSLLRLKSNEDGESSLEDRSKSSQVQKQRKTHDSDIIEITPQAHDESNNLNKNRYFNKHNSFNLFEEFDCPDKTENTAYNNQSSYAEFFSLFNTEYSYTDSLSKTNDVCTNEYATGEMGTSTNSCFDSSPSLIDYDSIFDMSTKPFPDENGFDSNALKSFVPYTNNNIQYQNMFDVNDFENDLRIFNFELDSNN